MPGVDVKRVRPTAVSPELALIDAELARAERARLDERAKLDAYRNAPQRDNESRVDVEHLRRLIAGVEDDDYGTRRRRNGPLGAKWLRPAALLGGSALVAGGLIAIFLHEDRRAASPSSTQSHIIAATATPPATPSTAGPASGEDPATEARGSQVTPTLERRILSLVAAAPRSKLPWQFVDRRTHTVAKDLRASCRQTGARTYACTVRSPERPSDEGLHVLYRLRRGGPGTFAWLGYLHG